MTTSYGYDNANRLTRLSHTTGGGSVTLGDYAFGLDAMGNRTTITETVALAGLGGAQRVLTATHVLLPFVANQGAPAPPTIQSSQNPILLPFVSNGGVGQSQTGPTVFPLQPVPRVPAQAPTAGATALPNRAAAKTATPTQTAAPSRTAAPSQTAVATQVPGQPRHELAGREPARGGTLPRAMASVTETTTITYSYDPLYRLTGASYMGSLTNTFGYTYDAVGNRLTQNASGTVISSTYDIANRLTNVNGQAYTWDDNGNLLNDGMQTYTYDQANRLKTAVQGGTTSSFAYNGVGDRLSQTVGITTTRYVLDPAAGLTQVLADGTNTYLYGNARLGQYQASMQYFGPDALGSVRQLFDASGVVVGSSRYDPFGNVMAQSGVTTVFAFAGEQQDAATGLTYLRARYYSSAQGRFTTRDVWEGDPNAPMSYNAWLYADSNPVNRLDPTGLFPIDDKGRYPGMCPQPPADKTAKRPLLISYQNWVYVYCGEFKLTSYQFVSEEDVYNAKVPIPQATAPLVLAPDMISPYRTSAAFIEDVETNGTGFSDNPILRRNCPSGYFNSVHWTVVNTSFTLSCGKGVRDIDASLAYHVAASDNRVIAKREEILIPLMRDRDEARLVVMDSGGQVAGYHLDVFVGQGRGLLTRDYENVPSSVWNRDHTYLGNTTVTLPNGQVKEARGPTPVYQRVAPGLMPYYRWMMCIMQHNGLEDLVQSLD